MSRLVVSISHVEFTETDQTFYVVKVTQDADEWQVRRAYSDFRHLRDDVARVLKDDKHQLVGDDASRAFARDVHALAFPGKRLFGSKRDHVVKDRAVALHHFLIRLLFLTHTYRKAQKQLYDAGAPPHDPTSLVARPQGSASVFYLLRDFLKPARTHAPDSASPGFGRHHSDDDSDDRARRLLRESKMLAMRASQHHQQQPPTPQKTKSAPQLLPERPRNASTPRRAAPPPPPPQPMAPEAVAAAVRMGASPPSVDALPLDPARRSVHFQSTPDEDEYTVSTQSKTLNIAAFAKPRAASTASVSSAASSSTASPTNASAPVRRVSKRNDRISSNEHQPVLRAIGSDLHIVESIPDPQPRSLSSSSTASSTASFNARSLEAATALGNNSSAAASLSNSFNEGGASARRRPHSKKKNLSSSMSSLSRAEKEMRNSERLSRLTPQLTAQMITVDAQKELEKHVSEYNAIMIMRYVDRFISKAVGKTPGCYTVMEGRLVIDSARFVQEIEDVLHDLPSNFQDAFRSGSGEWIIPKALDAYVQLKWNSFQSCNKANGDSGNASKSSSVSKRKNGKAVAASDSDDSDSDSEYETTITKPKKKDRTFTQEESDELQMMIAEGTAGREQMMRLRRQNDEKGWHRRTMPGAKYDNGSDTDEDDNGSGNESIKRFQAMQNAMRKSRMSRHDDIGGLV